VHGFIMLGGAKMSKSRGTGLSPLRYLELGMNPEWLRYYIAAKLNANVEDMEFNPDDFVARVNSDLVGKYVNIASRTAGFVAKRFGGRLGSDRCEQSHARRRARGVADDRHALRAAGIRQGPARDHGSSGRGECLHRAACSLGARERSEERCSVAGGVHRSA
jgi:methionyl-tRNA synthetase